MKNSIRILLVFLISASQSIACGWYPFGEQVRFSLMNPALFDDGGMSPYYFTAWDYGYSFESTELNDPNIALWSAYCGGKVDAKSIYKAIYELEYNDVKWNNSSNKMLLYLRENDQEALDYIAFAKTCSEFNMSDSDWEVDPSEKLERNKKILEALKKSQRVKSEMIKKRYRFLAVRLAYYNNDEDRVNSIYEKSFFGSPKDAIDYWAYYFKTTTEKISAERNYKLGQVFVNAPGKRFGVLTRFSREISLDEVLKYATTDTERANVHIMYAVRERGRGLATLKKVQKLDPKHPLLDYLLIREVNKLEDWILTPRYTNFDPTVDNRRETYDESNELIKERIADDEKYGREVADWISSLNIKTNKTWNLAGAYLKGITGNPQSALAILNSANDYPKGQQQLINRIKLLFNVRKNAATKLTIDEQNLLMNHKQDSYNMFLFAVSREYEFQQKLDVAAGLFSQVNKVFDGGYEGVSWKSATGKETLESDYYYSWFLYLDAEYSPKEVESVINFANTEFDKSTKFDYWQRQYLVEDINKLYDLLGTKYVRQNNMDAAISAFKKVGGDIWEEYPYQTFLNANPFHADFYSAHEPSEFDTVSYTKLEIAKLYKSYLEKAENPQTKNRAYYYFLVANCELNMSHHGNSWMMRRYFWTANMNPNYLEDDDDFFRLKRAQEFYTKAYEISSRREVKALCLRMVGRCEKHEIYFDAPDSWDFDYDSYGGFLNYAYSKNKAYERLSRDYPSDAADLLSNCYSFERYFAKMKD